VCVLDGRRALSAAADAVEGLGGSRGLIRQGIAQSSEQVVAADE
jgi:hypothetical protein